MAVAGCGGEGSTRVVTAVDKTTVRRCAPGSTRALGAPDAAVAAVVLRRTAAYRRPGGALLGRFGLKNLNGAATVFGVLGERVDARCRPTWLRVQLPMRPNGITGWVRAGDVATA